MAIENGKAVFSLRLPRNLADQIDCLANLSRRNRNGQIILLLEQAVDLQVEKDKKILAETKAHSGAV